MISVWGPMKWLARFRARSGSFLAPAMALWVCWWCSSCGPERVINAAANSICASGPRRASAFFTTAEVPVVADPGQGLGLANFNGVANQGRTCQRDVCETQYRRHQNDGEPRGTNRLECHGFSNLLSNHCELQETRRSKIASC